MQKTKIFHHSIINLLMAVLAVVFTHTLSAEELTKEQYEERVKQEEDQNTKLILAEVLKKAQALQETYGDFAPFAAALFPDGKVKFVWLAKPGETVSDPEKALIVLRSTLRGQAEVGRILGSGVIYKFKAPNTQKVQMNVELEYLSGYAKLIAAQFSQGEDKKLTYGAIKEAAYESNIFAPAEESEEKEKE